MSWSTTDVIKLIEVLKKYDVVWRWKKYLERDFYKIIDVVTEISSLVNKTNQEVLNQVEIIWKRLLKEYMVYNDNTPKDEHYVQWKFTNDFLFIFKDINDAVQVWRKLYGEMLNHQILFDENCKDVKLRSGIFAKIVNEGKFKTKYAGVLKQPQLIALVTNFKYMNCKRPFIKCNQLDINKLPKLFHTPNEPRFQLPSFYLKLWDLTDECKRKKPVSSLSDCEVQDYEPEIHPDLNSIEINSLLENIPIVNNTRNKYDNETLFQLLFLNLSSLCIKSGIYNFLDDNVQVQKLWKLVAESFETAGYSFTIKELTNFWKYILTRARSNAKKHRENSEEFAMSNLDLEINYIFPESKTDPTSDKLESKPFNSSTGLSYLASTSIGSNSLTKKIEEEKITYTPSELLHSKENKSTRTEKCIIDLTDSEELQVIEDSSDDDCKILINFD